MQPSSFISFLFLFLGTIIKFSEQLTQFLSKNFVKRDISFFLQVFVHYATHTKHRNTKKKQARM